MNQKMTKAEQQALIDAYEDFFERHAKGKLGYSRGFFAGGWEAARRWLRMDHKSGDGWTPMVEIAVVEAVLAEHWISSLICDHNGQTDTAHCACGQWSGTAQPTVGDAVKEWAFHVVAQAVR